MRKTGIKRLTKENFEQYGSYASILEPEGPCFGEEPVLFAAPNAGATITAEQILDHCRKNLSKYKLPVDITIVDELPKNPVGKLDKPKLRRSLSTSGI